MINRFIIFILFILCSCNKYEPICECINVPDPTPMSLSYPNNFPSPNIPVWNPLTEEGVNLGRHLFYDPILSSDNTVSCASCHKLTSAFADDSQYSIGVGQALGERNAPTIMNVAFQNVFDWDGKSSSLEQQAIRPIFNEVELHNNNWTEVISRLKMSELYSSLFCAAFGTEDIDSLHILMAISQFERTLNSFNSRFDQWFYNGGPYTPEEMDGFNIFATERGDCFHCHPIGLFTDNTFHNNGLDSEFNDLGRYNITGNPLDEGLFKSPTLRNIEFTAPYMHDGRFNTLDEVIEHYNFGGYDSPTVDPLMKYVGKGLLLTEQEKSNLKAFLLSLSDSSFINNLEHANPFYE
jgi:cytochrome c peroxidase